MLSILSALKSNFDTQIIFVLITLLGIGDIYFIKPFAKYQGQRL